MCVCRVLPQEMNSSNDLEPEPDSSMRSAEADRKPGRLRSVGLCQSFKKKKVLFLSLKVY